MKNENEDGKKGAALLFDAYLDGRFGGKPPRRSPGVIRRAEAKDAAED
jgi:hypothetical protein